MMKKKISFILVAILVIGVAIFSSNMFEIRSNLLGGTEETKVNKVDPNQSAEESFYQFIDKIPTYGALNTGHSVNVRFAVLYVGSEFNTGYNFGSSESTTFICQYKTSHSDTAYSNHTIAISDIRSASTRLSLNSGYSFVGWTKSASANPTIFSLTLSGDTAANKGATIYLVAKRQAVTYSLKYNANGGSGAPAAQNASSTATSYNFTISNTIPTRSGYTFKGWSTSSSATTPSYVAGGTINVTGSTTLYAVWQKNANYQARIIFNSNASGETVTGMPSEANLSGTTTSLSYTIPNNVPVRKGYTFKGWSSTSTGTAEFDATDVVTVPAGTSSVTTRFYAVWQKTTADYKVEWYDVEGNTLKAPETRTGTVGTSVQVTTSDLEIAGYTFDSSNTGNITSKTLAENGTVLKLYFARNKANYKVEWYDTEGNTLKQAETRVATLDDIVSVTNGDKVISGYTLDSKNPKNVLSLKLTENGTILKLYFTRNEITYKVEWYDENGTSIRTSEIRKGYENEEVTVTDEDKSVTGYTFDESNVANILKQTLNGEDKVLKLYFTKDKVSTNYRVEWYDEAGNIIRETEVRTANVDDVVTVTPSDKIIDKYTFDSNNLKNVLTQTVSEEGTVLKLYFIKNKVNYTVEWYDENGKVIKTEVRKAEIDDIVSVTDEDKSLEGYLYNEGFDGQVETATVDEKGATLKLYFNKIIVYKVEWYDETGNVIKTSEIRTGVLGSIVSVTDSDKIVDGYTFVTDSNGNKLSDIVRVDGDTVLRLYFTTGNEIPKEVDTGDNNTTLLYVILCVLSLGGIVSLSIVKNKKLS